MKELGDAVRPETIGQLPPEWFWAWAGLYDDILVSDISIKHKRPVCLDTIFSASSSLETYSPSWEVALEIVTGSDKAGAFLNYLKALDSYQEDVTAGVRWLLDTNPVITPTQASGLLTAVEIFSDVAPCAARHLTWFLRGLRLSPAPVSIPEDDLSVLKADLKLDPAGFWWAVVAAHLPWEVRKDFSQYHFSPFLTIFGIQDEECVNFFEKMSTVEQSNFFRILPPLQELKKIAWNKNDMLRLVSSTLKVCSAL